MNCRHCGNALQHTFADLGSAPPSNAYRLPEQLNKPEVTYPLEVCVCEKCWLVQTKDFVAADEMFSADYAYFSSVSSGWLQHAADYVAMIIAKLQLDSSRHVIEIASNDGYLLKNFVSAGIPCLGIEPTTETAAKSREFGIPVMESFFTLSLAKQLTKDNQQADLVIGNNVLAHVPDINDFVSGLLAVLKDDGVVTMEFPHLLELIKHCQFDTIYHEHFSYLSLSVVKRIFNQAGLDIFDVEQLPTHGGSLRIYASKTALGKSATENVQRIIDMEIDNGLQDLDTYLGFQQKIDKLTKDLVDFLESQKQAGKTVLGYGAAAKGNTLLNYAGIKVDLLPAICDAAPSKQGKLMPGSQIPIYSPDYLSKNRPNYLLILPWNIADEVKNQNAELAKVGTKFVTVAPMLKIS
jgi:SAM-dependent methyltransferase